jgi:hypothetical protein
MARAVGEELRGRGVTDPAAALTAEAGVAVFRVAFEHWAVDPARPSFPAVLAAALAELRTAVTG